MAGYWFALHTGNLPFPEPQSHVSWPVPQSLAFAAALLSIDGIDLPALVPQWALADRGAGPSHDVREYSTQVSACPEAEE
ncbi:UNVERIFIED_CONTAM: hypothetical protein K2H54_002437 [Gekko kuhli]